MIGKLFLEEIIREEAYIKISNIGRYQLKKVFSTIGFFLLIIMIHILLSDTEDFPLLRSIVGVIVFSLFVSLFETFLVKKLQKYLRASTLLMVSVFYYSFIFFLLLLSFIYVNLIFKENHTLQEAFFTNILEMIPGNIQYMLFYLFIFLTIRSLMQILKMRSLPGVNKNFFWRKPNESISDTRIFMFMDLISSTSYAEKLGYSNYSRFIKDIYSEMDEYVLETKGNVYQYVGDEVVVVWTLKEGIKNLNCLRFFMLFEERMLEMKKYFFSEYGIFPKFKAGFHYGEVAIAEVGGILRRDVAFHGDVVNTTSRICAKCKELDEEILLSRDLAEILMSEKDEILFESIGNYRLKGKKEEVELLRIGEFMHTTKNHKISFRKKNHVGLV